MPKQSRKKEPDNTFQPVLDFIDLVDTAFERLTGAKISDRLKEASGQPRALPPENEPTAPAEPGMPLADAYSILGLKPDAPLDDVKKHYRNLAKLFHPDKGMNDEAMKLINRAYETITKPKGGK